ncbi:MAG: hypothetical protein FJ404_12230 [Verrucomicrobia bacterium]|nr:hypothetical protein [Verrucomicrobiota bacterium]
MKTTIDLADDLLIKAKTLAIHRRTTLKAIIESALIREIRPAAELENPDPEKYEIGPFGILRIKRRPGEKTTLEQVKAIQDQIDEADMHRALHPTRP